MVLVDIFFLISVFLTIWQIFAKSHNEIECTCSNVLEVIFLISPQLSEGFYAHVGAWKSTGAGVEIYIHELFCHTLSDCTMVYHSCTQLVRLTDKTPYYFKIVLSSSTLCHTLILHITEVEVHFPNTVVYSIYIYVHVRVCRNAWAFVQNSRMSVGMQVYACTQGCCWMSVCVCVCMCVTFWGNSPLLGSQLSLWLPSILQVSDLPSADEWQGVWSGGMEGREGG